MALPEISWISELLCVWKSGKIGRKEGSLKGKCAYLECLVAELEKECGEDCSEADEADIQKKRDERDLMCSLLKLPEWANARDELIAAVGRVLAEPPTLSFPDREQDEAARNAIQDVLDRSDSEY